MVENMLITEAGAIMEAKDKESEELKIFIENINRKEENKDNLSTKRKEEEPKQWRWNDTKKYMEIHRHSLKNWVEIQALKERNGGELPYTKEQIQKQVVDYIELCNLLNYSITLSGVCLYLGTNDQTKMAGEINELIKPLLEGKLNSQANNSNLQFLMKHRYKRNDKLELTTSVNQQTAQGVIDKIIQENNDKRGANNASLQVLPPSI